MRNARTLIERVVISKAIEGELRTFDVDMHQAETAYEVYVFDPDEAFSVTPLEFSEYREAKEAFSEFVDLIMKEPVLPTDSPFDFAERVSYKMSIKTHYS